MSWDMVDTCPKTSFHFWVRLGRPGLTPRGLVAAVGVEREYSHEVAGVAVENFDGQGRQPGRPDSVPRAVTPP